MLNEFKWPEDIQHQMRQSNAELRFWHDAMHENPQKKSVVSASLWPLQRWTWRRLTSTAEKLRADQAIKHSIIHASSIYIQHRWSIWTKYLEVFGYWWILMDIENIVILHWIYHIDPILTIVWVLYGYWSTMFRLFSGSSSTLFVPSCVSDPRHGITGRPCLKAVSACSLMAGWILWIHIWIHMDPMDMKW